MRRTFYDQDELPYHDLLCDGCAARYRSHTDACYDWALLVDEATFAGWDVRDPDPYGSHLCPQCVAASFVRTDPARRDPCSVA